MLPMLEDHREIDFSKAMYVPLGMASPLWLPFAAATSAGLAYWWMTRWTRPADLQSMMGAVESPTGLPAVVEPPLPMAEPVLEAVEAVTAQAEKVAEAAAETMETVTAEAQHAVETVAEAAQPVAPAVAKRKPKAQPDAPLH